jgi:predicted KAP-like P-loop ATPase
VVVGVLGPWGSGKTSFINLARAEFSSKAVTLVDFNPWMFSGTEQLVQSFFGELAAQLRVRPTLAEIAAAVEQYGDIFSGVAWLPIVGPWIERGKSATKALGKVLQRRKQGVGVQRQKLEKILVRLERPIVVVLDDIDRLQNSEIRDIFKLVRLTASFPNVVYILAFDRMRVEGALSETGVPGRDYLEKILQVSIDLPAVPEAQLYEQILASTQEALSGIENAGPWDDQILPDIFAEIVRPLIRNMRDVRRYASMLRGTVIGLNGQVSLADVLALEAVRIFLPDVFGLLHSSISALTTTSGASYGMRAEPSHLKSTIDGLVSAGNTHQEVVRSMITRLFPAAIRHLGGSHYGPEWKREWIRKTTRRSRGPSAILSRTRCRCSIPGIHCERTRV